MAKHIPGASPRTLNPIYEGNPWTYLDLGICGVCSWGLLKFSPKTPQKQLITLTSQRSFWSYRQRRVNGVTSHLQDTCPRKNVTPSKSYKVPCFSRAARFLFRRWFQFPIFFTLPEKKWAKWRSQNDGQNGNGKTLRLKTYPWPIYLVSIDGRGHLFGRAREFVFPHQRRLREAETLRDYEWSLPPIIISRWWQLKYFLCSSRKLGKMNPIWLIFFNLGWFNHQLDIIWKIISAYPVVRLDHPHENNTWMTQWPCGRDTPQPDPKRGQEFSTSPWLLTTY